jgi:hypothetical protein
MPNNCAARYGQTLLVPDFVVLALQHCTFFLDMPNFWALLVTAHQSIWYRLRADSVGIMALSLGECALHAEHEAIVEFGGIVTAVLIK